MQPPNLPPLPILDPVPTLRQRIAAELSAQFDLTSPLRLSRAPGRLDVMGGIADCTGSQVCEATLDRAAAMALQERDDRELQVFSFNLFDEHLPFTFRIALEALSHATAEGLRRDFAEPSRRWAAYIAGCLFILHEQKLVNLHDQSIKGLNLALLSDVPLGGGVASSAAIEVATMMNLLDHFGLRGRVDPMRTAALCQQVENRIVGALCGSMDQVTSLAGTGGTLLRLVCQPHELSEPLVLPEGIRAIGICSKVRHSAGGGMYGRTRCAAFMGHTIILAKMRKMGESQGRTLVADPMNGYLANLDADDYKSLFRDALPASMRGLDFLEQYGPTADKATTVHPDQDYHVQAATDHHVFEARRVRQFVEFLERAAKLPPGRERLDALNKAGHLMYASHVSCGNNAQLGAAECDLLVDLVRQREHLGFYGARITAGGSGGTVAILANTGEKADAAIAEIMGVYEQRTGRKPEAFLASSPGAWEVGTTLA